jgi:hypothetical protein
VGRPRKKATQVGEMPAAYVRSPYAHDALMEVLGGRLGARYQEARDRAGGTYWAHWIPALWEVADKYGLREEAMEACRVLLAQHPQESWSW